MKNAGLFILALAVLAIGNNLVWRISRDHVCTLLSPVELQERLGVVADGKIGPETMEAWQRACPEEDPAAKYMEPFVGEDGYLDANWK